jgi:16S rRNA (cytosine967-C5)-methyltransferase
LPPPAHDDAFPGHALAESFALAAQVVAKVIGGASLSPVLIASVAPRAAPALRAAVQDLSYKTLRVYGVPQAITQKLLQRPVTDVVLLALLYVALVDLRARADHAHTVVDQAVVAARNLGRNAATGLVNAVLRNYLRQRDAIEARLARDDVARHAHPRWWIDRVRARFPHDWVAVLAASNTPPPMTLRVNERATDVPAYLAQLAAAGIEATALGASAVMLAKPMPVDRLPGFHAGMVSVQDAGAQRAAALLDAQPGERVLDACAAPGGKTAHLLERTDVDLVALDDDPARVERIEENLRRLRLRARVLTGDAANPEAWWDGKPFDRVLCDVPCTASGVVRRHPDIKWLRRPADVARFAGTQSAILEALWQVVAPGGRLLYVTCSIFTEENDERIAAFLGRHDDAARVPLPGFPPGLPEGQLLPDPTHDGFYYALLAKR